MFPFPIRMVTIDKIVKTFYPIRHFVAGFAVTYVLIAQLPSTKKEKKKSLHAKE